MYVYFLMCMCCSYNILYVVVIRAPLKISVSWVDSWSKYYNYNYNYNHLFLHVVLSFSHSRNLGTSREWSQRIWIGNHCSFLVIMLIGLSSKYAQKSSLSEIQKKFHSLFPVDFHHPSWPLHLCSICNDSLK